MSLMPDDFQFNQGNLQDFIDCRRRFFYRHIKQLAWPAVEAEPVIQNERRMQIGNIFHKLVQQHLIGIPVDFLQAMVEQSEYANEGLALWFQNYLNYASLLFEEAKKHEVEYVLATSITGYRLVAKYDVLLWGSVGDEAHVTIVDWKTYAFRPSRKWLSERMQTRIYTFLAVQASSQLANRSCSPNGVKMLYWFPEHPQNPEQFRYDQQQYEHDLRMLEDLITEITHLNSEDQFPLTEIEGRCSFCTYRSLCERGTQAGKLVGTEDSEEEDLLIDFDQIAEIEF
jgi:PD-(D/E)XK nuclease superfamily